MSLEENKQIARRFIDEILNKGNIDEADSFVTPDFVYHTRGERVEGVEKFKEWVSSDRDIFSNIQYTVVDTIAEYGKVATAWIVEGTHDKEFRGIPATHKKFETVGINIFHFEGTKIKNAWAVVDGLTPAIELGVVKTTSSEAEVA